MWKRLIIISTVASALSMTAAWAMEGSSVERDPFYPSADRPGMTAPPPSSGAGENWGRDPFNNPLANRAPIQKGPASPGQVRVLTGIIYSEDVRIAIFGGETYTIGSKVGDKKLSDIRMRSVVFMSPAGEREEVFLEDFTMNK